MKKTSFFEVRKYLEPLLKKGVENDVFSGVAVGVYKGSEKTDEKLVLCKGKTRNDSQAKPILETTLFDIASLTKPLCTVLSILHLIEINKISLQSTLESCLRTEKASFFKVLKIAHLLSHSAGLKAYKPYYLDFKPIQREENKKKLLKSINNETPINPPGMQCEYSDLGYILLGEAIENLTHLRIDEFFNKRITEPLGLDNKLMFRPIDEYGKKKDENIAATQKCPWRKRVLQGEVDDEHSWLMNGIGGHAGLFGTIEGVLDMCVHILKQWKGKEEHPSFRSELLQKALTKQYKKQTWCLGFDTPSQKGSSGGKFLSKHSVGHLGFTGTSFWIDPVKEVVVVLLTNRIHPDRNNNQIKQFRPILHDTVFKALA